MVFFSSIFRIAVLKRLLFFLILLFLFLGAFLVVVFFLRWLVGLIFCFWGDWRTGNSFFGGWLTRHIFLHKQSSIILIEISFHSLLLFLSPTYLTRYLPAVFSSELALVWGWALMSWNICKYVSGGIDS